VTTAYVIGDLPEVSPLELPAACGRAACEPLSTPVCSGS